MAPFVDSTYALSLLYRERDFICTSMSSIVKQCRNVAVNILGSVVGVEVENDVGETLQQRVEHGNEEYLADPLAGRHTFVLGHTVDSIDVIDPFHAVLITLVDTVHPQLVAEWHNIPAISACTR
jgi:hypothetical protein